MIVAWMLYTMLVSLLLFAGAAAAEVVCRALGWATRTVWIGALSLSVALSARALVVGTRPPTVQSATVLAPGRPASVADSLAEPRPVKPLLSNARAALVFPSRAVSSIGRRGSLQVDGAIAVALLAAAIGGVSYLIFGMLRVRHIVRALEAREVSGHRVLVSDELGPALLGIVRPRIVIPRWVLSLNEADRHVILTHEHQHAEAHDSVLIAGAALLLALSPWNVALWVMFARLRLAIEIDCDRRVLALCRDARRYGNLLVTVYERTASVGMQLAFVAPASSLERRIRRLVDVTPPRWSARGIAASMVAVSLAVAACGTEVPTENMRDAYAVRVSVVGALPRCLQPIGALTMFEDMRTLARVRHPDLAGTIRGRETIIGFLLDEHCTVQRDTVVTVANWPRPRPGARDVFQAVFGDTIVGRRNGGTTFMYSADHKEFLTIAYAVRPSAEWGTRLSRTPCGIGIRFEDQCAMQGPLVIRMLDSVRAVVAIRGFHAPNKPVNDLFLVTLSRPNAAFASQSMEHGVLSFQSGALYIEDYLAPAPRIWVGARDSKGLAELKTLPDVRVIYDIVGIAHYAGLRLTLEQLARLRPVARCDALPGSCYEVDGHRIEFP
jgi:beta-lactamase regulating signal transducer with metallopeptidase domain